MKTKLLLGLLSASVVFGQPATQGLDLEGKIEAQSPAGTFVAKPASDFIDSIGSATHLGRYQTIYVTRFAEWKPLFLALGIRHIRTDSILQPQAIRNARELADAGVKFNMSSMPDGWAVPKGEEAQGLSDALLNGSAKNLAYIPAFIAHIKAHFLDCTESIEGLNEPDGYAEHARRWMEELRQQGRADPAFAHVQFLGSALSNPRANAVKAGDWTPVVDLANLHAYPGGRAPEISIPEYLKALEHQYRGRPIYITETGYHNALNNPPNRHRPASREVEAVYMPRLFLEYFRLGIARSYDFMLLDDRTEEEALKKYSIPVLQEAHFGLLDYNLRPKPAYFAIKNLIGLLNDKPGAHAAPRSVEYSLSGPTELRHVLLQKADGTLCLAVWRAVSIWDPVARKDLLVAEASVTVKFPSPVKNVSLYRPSVSPEAFARIADTDAVPLSLTGDVVIIAFRMP